MWQGAQTHVQHKPIDVRPKYKLTEQDDALCGLARHDAAVGAAAHPVAALLEAL